MRPGRLAVLAALALLLALYVSGVAAGSGRGDGGSLQEGLPAALARVLVRPGGTAELGADPAGCRHGSRVLVPAGGSCSYRLRTGFLAVRLRPRLASAGEVELVLERSRPSGTERWSLDAAHAAAELTYREPGTVLTLTCAGSSGSACEVTFG